LESDEEWNPFKQTRVDFDSFNTRVMRTSSHTSKFSDGTTILTLIKNMGDRETTNVITIMPDGAWKQETRTKFVKKRSQWDFDDDADADDEDDIDIDNIIVPSKPKEPTKPKTPTPTKPKTPSKCIKKHSVPKCGKC